MSAIGFPDFRRQVEWDSNPALSVVLNGAQASGVTFGPFNVANFASVTGTLQAVSGALQANFSFYTDPALVGFCGDRNIFLDSAQFGAATFKLRTLGRFFTLNITNSGGGNIAYAHTLVGSNRVGGPEIVSQDGVIVSPQFPVIGAGGNFTLLTHAVGSGKATWWVQTSGQPGSFALETISPLGAWSQFNGMVLPAASAQNIPVSLPLSTVRIRIFNTGAAGGTFFSALTVDTT